MDLFLLLLELQEIPAAAAAAAAARPVAVALEGGGAGGVDAGVEALEGGALQVLKELEVVLEVAGEFPAGALVALRDTEGEFGRGLCNVPSESLRHIAGLKSAEVVKLLGDETPTAVIHRDNLTLASR